MPMGENNSKLFRVHVTLKRSISGGFLQGQSLSQVFDGQKTFIMMIQLPAAPCPSGTDTSLPFQGVSDRMLTFTLQILLQIKVGGTQNTRPGSAMGLCLRGGSRKMSQIAVGKRRLVSGTGTAPCKVIHAHTQVRAAEGL